MGQLSEEAQEAKNKEYRRFREHKTRKSSKLETTEDLIHMLLISSDPVISFLRTPAKTVIKELWSEALDLLLDKDSDSKEEEDD